MLGAAGACDCGPSQPEREAAAERERLQAERERLQAEIRLLRQLPPRRPHSCNEALAGGSPPPPTPAVPGPGTGNEAAGGITAEARFDRTLHDRFFPARVVEGKVQFTYRCDPGDELAGRLAPLKYVFVWTGTGFAGRLQVRRVVQEGCCDGTACDVTVEPHSLEPPLAPDGPALVVLPCRGAEECPGDALCDEGRCTARGEGTDRPPLEPDRFCAECERVEFEIDGDGRADAVLFVHPEGGGAFDRLYLFDPATGRWERSWKNELS